MATLKGKLKHQLKNVPLVLPTYKKLRALLVTKSPYPFTRTAWDSTQSAQTQSRTKILNMLDYTKTSGSGYDGSQFPAGYHELELFGEVVAGQRKPADRLDKVPMDLTGKTVLDIGCNQGGMIFALQDKLRWGVGVDYDFRMVNACNSIKNELDLAHTRFYVFDVDREPHALLQDCLPEPRVDVVFLLAVCFWVREWKALIRYAASISDHMLFEANGDDASMEEQIAYLETVYGTVTQLSDDSNEDTTCRTRKLLWVSNPKNSAA